MVDGEVIGNGAEGSPRLELRWIDALRAPGAGGYRTVVDVVEERRSGRLTVMNGRASVDTTASNNWNGGVGGQVLPRQPQQQQQQQQEMVQISPIPRGDDGKGKVMGNERSQKEQLHELPEEIRALIPAGGIPTRRALEEAARERKQQQQQQLCLTPIRRKPVPVHGNPLITPPQTPPKFRLNSNHVDDDETRIYFQRRKAPLTRPPIPDFSSSVKDVMEKKEGSDVGDGDDVKGVVESGKYGSKEEEEEEKEEEEEEEKEIDWFWVDERGDLMYRRSRPMVVD